MTEYDIFRDLPVDAKIQRFLFWLMLDCNSYRGFHCVTLICEIACMHITNISDLIDIHVSDTSQIILIMNNYI